MTYIEADDLRSGALYPYIRVPASGSVGVPDARLEAMIDAAEIIVDNYTADHFEAADPDADETLTVYGDGGPRLYMPRSVREVTSLTVTNHAGTVTDVDDTYYYVPVVSTPGSLGDRLELLKSLPVHHSWWPAPPWSIQVTGKFGWETPPDAVRHATALIVWSWCQSAIPPNVEEVTSAGSTYAAPTVPGSTGVVQADRLLEPYRRLAHV